MKTIYQVKIPMTLLRVEHLAGLLIGDIRGAVKIPMTLLRVEHLDGNPYVEVQGNG